MAPFQPIKKHKKRSRTFDIIPIEEDEIKASKLSYRERFWMMRYFELKKFKQQYGHCNPSLHNKQYQSVAEWCVRQRGLKKKYPDKYDLDREQLLNSIGFELERKQKILTDQQLLDDLKRLYHQLKKVPSLAEIKKHGNYSLSAYYKHFGSMPAARKKIGLPLYIPMLHGYRYIPDEKLLDDLKRLHRELKKIPSATHIKNFGKYSSVTYLMRFGSLPNARQKAGMGADTLNKLTDQQLLDDLKRLYHQLKKVPSLAEIKKYGKYSSKAYCNHFGSLPAARKKAEIPALSIYQITDQQLLDALRDLAPYLKTMSLTHALYTYGKYSIHPYLKRFGSLKNAFIKAGIKPST